MRITLLAVAASLWAHGGAASGVEPPGSGTRLPEAAAAPAGTLPALTPSAPASVSAPPAAASAPGTDAPPPRGPRPPAGVDALVVSPSLRPPPRSDAAAQLPIVLLADRITSQPDLQTRAEGDVVFSRGALSIAADMLSYDTPEDLAVARGHVRVVRDGAVYAGPELQLRVRRFEGYFLEPTFEFPQIGAGGRARRVDFLGRSQLQASDASYTSCPRDGAGEPAWVLRADGVRLDLDANEGVADGAVLRFLGVPILALPSGLSFPLTDARKSGWLPPSLNINNRSGVELSVPYYWNIAPQRDATIVPRAFTRRGLGVDAEFRYLQPDYTGGIRVEWLPHDRQFGASRESLRWRHDGTVAAGIRLSADVARVSDDDWWKDFPDAARSLAPRLLPLDVGLSRPFAAAGIGGEVYARALQWQVLQDRDSFIVSPYERSPQIGLRADAARAGFEVGVVGEFNRFTLPHGQATTTTRPVGDRLHLLGAVARPLRGPGWWLTPKVSVNAASYVDTRRPAAGGVAGATASRTIPTVSVDGGLEFERRTTFFGHAFEQTLEPRLLYVRTPYREQRGLPNYDAAAKDLSFASIYSENPFAGVDRVADAHQLTAGVTTRLIDPDSGAEALRLGLVQRYLFDTQRIAPQPDGTPDGPPLTQRFSDALLLGSTHIVPAWTFDAAIQYSPELRRSVRSIVGVRWSPGPFRTVSTTYRLARGLAEQVEVGWQWPVWRGDAAAGGRCNGSLYSVGRANYSLKDSRVTDSLLGLEYDAGCWIGRVVAERLSTGRSEATTRLMLQLELVGLSRLGSNPLQVLKDNIPGYRLLRDDVRGAALP